VIARKHESLRKTLALVKLLEQATAYNFLEWILSSGVNWAINWQKGVGRIQLSALARIWYRTFKNEGKKFLINRLAINIPWGIIVSFPIGKRLSARFDVSTVLLLSIQFFWDVTLFHRASVSSHQKKIRKNLPADTGSHPRRPGPSRSLIVSRTSRVAPEPSQPSILELRHPRCLRNNKGRYVEVKTQLVY
jgi:hypothetical protein